MYSEWYAFLPACLLRNNKSLLCPAQARRDNYSYWLNHLPQRLLGLQLLASFFLRLLPPANCAVLQHYESLFFKFYTETMMGVGAALPLTLVCKRAQKGKWFKVCLWLKLRHNVCCEFICRSESISSRHDTFIHFSHFQRKNLGFLESQICYSKSFSTLQINEALINNTLVLCFYLFYMLNLCVRQWYYCPALSFCYSWEHMNLKIELQPVFTVNTFPPRLHEVAGPWLSIEKGEKKERGPLKRCFVLV